MSGAFRGTAPAAPAASTVIHDKQVLKHFRQRLGSWSLPNRGRGSIAVTGSDKYALHMSRASFAASGATADRVEPLAPAGSSSQLSHFGQHVGQYQPLPASPESGGVATLNSYLNTPLQLSSNSDAGAISSVVQSQNVEQGSATLSIGQYLEKMEQYASDLDQVCKTLAHDQRPRKSSAFTASGVRNTTAPPASNPPRHSVAPLTGAPQALQTSQGTRVGTGAGVGVGLGTQPFTPDSTQGLVTANAGQQDVHAFKIASHVGGTPPRSSAPESASAPRSGMDVEIFDADSIIWRTATVVSVDDVAEECDMILTPSISENDPSQEEDVDSAVVQTVAYENVRRLHIQMRAGTRVLVYQPAECTWVSGTIVMTPTLDPESGYRVKVDEKGTEGGGGSFDTMGAIRVPAALLKPADATPRVGETVQVMDLGAARWRRGFSIVAGHRDNAPDLHRTVSEAVDSKAPDFSARLLQMYHLGEGVSSSVSASTRNTETRYVPNFIMRERNSGVGLPQRRASRLPTVSGRASTSSAAASDDLTSNKPVPARRSTGENFRALEYDLGATVDRAPPSHNVDDMTAPEHRRYSDAIRRLNNRDSAKAAVTEGSADTGAGTGMGAGAGADRGMGAAILDGEAVSSTVPASPQHGRVPSLGFDKFASSGWQSGTEALVTRPKAGSSPEVEQFVARVRDGVQQRKPPSSRLVGIAQRHARARVRQMQLEAHQDMMESGLAANRLRSRPHQMVNTPRLRQQPGHEALYTRHDTHLPNQRHGEFEERPDWNASTFVAKSRKKSLIYTTYEKEPREDAPYKPEAFHPLPIKVYETSGVGAAVPLAQKLGPAVQKRLEIMAAIDAEHEERRRQRMVREAHLSAAQHPHPVGQAAGGPGRGQAALRRAQVPIVMTPSGSGLVNPGSPARTQSRSAAAPAAPAARPRRRSWRESRYPPEERKRLDEHERQTRVYQGRTPWNERIKGHDVSDWIQRARADGTIVTLKDALAELPEEVRANTSMRRGSFFGGSVAKMQEKDSRLLEQRVRREVAAEERSHAARPDAADPIERHIARMHKGRQKRAAHHTPASPTYREYDNSLHGGSPHQVDTLVGDVTAARPDLEPAVVERIAKNMVRDSNRRASVAAAQDHNTLSTRIMAGYTGYLKAN